MDHPDGRDPGRKARARNVQRPSRRLGSTTKQPLRDESGEIIGTFGLSRDVTAQVDAQAALTYQAHHDSVTGLANRPVLMERVQQALADLEGRPERFALLFIDLDDFKGL